MGATAGTSIHSYNLFGETSELPDVVHCETLAARSVLHGWTITPHRHARLHQVLLVARGGGKATIEGREYRLGPMRAVNVPAGQVHGYTFKPGTKGWVVTLASEILDQVLVPSEDVRRTLSESSVFHGSPAMRKLVTTIFSEYAGRSYARAHILRSLSAMLVGHVARALTSSQSRGGHTPGAKLVKNFEELIETHFREHWPVARYAAALKVTPTHLSRVTRAAYGCAASRLIRERVIREARRNLVYTDLPISTLAYALGFDDPAYFSRTFADATGLSPREFRNRAHAA